MATYVYKGEKKYERVKNLMYDYEDVDFAWASSDEMVFLENIIDARLAYNQHMFADHLYFWDNVRVLRVLDLRMFKHINHEINEELQRREEQRIAARNREEQRIREEARQQCTRPNPQLASACDSADGKERRGGK